MRLKERIIAFVMAAVMVVSMVVGLDFSIVSTASTNAITLKKDVIVNVSNYGSTDITFTPTSSAWYYIYSTDYEEDPNAVLLDSSGNYLVSNDDCTLDVYTSDKNFGMFAKLKKGKTYTIRCSCGTSGRADRYTVSVARIEDVSYSTNATDTGVWDTATQSEILTFSTSDYGKEVSLTMNISKEVSLEGYGTCSSYDVDIDDENYSWSYYRGAYYDDDGVRHSLTNSVVATGKTYTFTLDESCLYNYKNVVVYYYCNCKYLGTTTKIKKNVFLHNESDLTRNIYKSWEEEVGDAHTGQSITLEATLTLNGDYVDLSDSSISLKWINLANGYVISKKETTKITVGEWASNTYVCKIYLDDVYIGCTSYHIINIKYDQTETEETEEYDVTLIGNLYNEYGDEIDLSDDNYSFSWIDKDTKEEVCFDQEYSFDFGDWQGKYFIFRVYDDTDGSLVGYNVYYVYNSGHASPTDATATTDAGSQTTAEDGADGVTVVDYLGFRTTSSTSTSSSTSTTEGTTSSDTYQGSAQTSTTTEEPQGSYVVKKASTEATTEETTVATTEDAASSLTAGTNVTVGNYSYQVNGNFTVTFTGTSCDSDDTTFTSITIDTVTIDGQKYTVTAVADNAFAGYKYLETITIGSKVTSIGNNAFKGCTKLKTVKGCKAVTTVGDNAFCGCTKLTTVGSKKNAITLPKVTTIGKKAFYNCKSVKMLNLTSKNLAKIGAQAFRNCKSVTKVVLKTTKLTTKNVNSKAFKGISSTCTFKVPKTKITAYTTLVKKRGAAKTVTVKK